MRRVRSGWLAAIAIASLVSAPAAHAGIPVIDVAGLVQAIMEVLNSVEQVANQVSQIENQVQQIESAHKTLDSLTGSRNLGNVFNSPGLQNYLPTNALDTYNSVNDGYDSMSAPAKSLRDAELIYNCLDKEGTARRQCQAMLGRPYQAKAAMQRAVESSNGRVAQIQQLMTRINSTEDPKDIAELQARIGAENALLLNEMSRAQYMQGVYDADARADQNRNEEQRMEALTRTGSILDKVPRP